MGKVTVYNADYTQSWQKPQTANPYLYTGRRLDILDDGSLKLQYSRHRYYDPETGRFLQKDPLGIVPSSSKYNPFEALQQYSNGVGLQVYVNSEPVNSLDPLGLVIKSYKQGVHVGLLLDGTDVDFGPKGGKGGLLPQPGECPYMHNNLPGSSPMVPTKTFSIDKTGIMEMPGKKIKQFSCVTEAEAKTCIMAWCADFNKKNYCGIHPNCRTFNETATSIVA
nr:RHS repeat-associated core domain-containing protein [Anaerohalosphaera lusitana]